MSSKLISGCVAAGLVAAAIYVVIAGLVTGRWTSDTLIGGGLIGAVTAVITWGISMVIARTKRP
jgi:hypothetical protein